MNTVTRAQARSDSSHPPEPPDDNGHGSGGFYTPGHLFPKLLMTLLGLCLISFALTQLWTPLNLLFRGIPTTAEATRVIKSKEGLPDIVLADDVQIRSAQEGRDRSYLFTNEFHFRTAQGRDVVVNLPTREQLKPLYPLVDEDGLPTTVRIYYDPQQPQRVLFPLVFSTWFVPGMIAFLGTLCTVIGGTLAYWANKPIELPHLSR